MKNEYIKVEIDVNESFNVDIKLEDIIRRLKIEDAILIANKFNIRTRPTKSTKSIELNRNELYRFICDICDVNYHTPYDTLLELLKNKF